MTTPTLYRVETELSSVNAILGAIGQAPISSIYTTQGDTLVYTNPEVALVYYILQECNNDVQNEGWVFNREEHFEMEPNMDKEIEIEDYMLRIDISEGQVYRDRDVCINGGVLYDKVNHTSEFENTIECDITWRYDFDDIPSVFKRYITNKASTRAATQMVSNPELAKLLAQQEAISRAACIEYECNQGDYSYFGTPYNVIYRSYQPYKTLAR